MVRVPFADLVALLAAIFERHGAPANVAAILASNCATAERVGSLLRDIAESFALSKEYLCIATESVGQAFTADVDAVVLWNTDEYDPDNLHDILSNTGRFLIPEAGAYALKCNVGFAAAAGVNFVMWARKNGTTLITGSQVGSRGGGTTSGVNRAIWAAGLRRSRSRIRCPISCSRAARCRSCW
jgi:hypothetical protein